MRNVTETQRRNEKRRDCERKNKSKGGGDSTESQRVESSNHNFDGDNLSTVLTVLLLYCVLFCVTLLLFV